MILLSIETLCLGVYNWSLRLQDNLMLSLNIKKKRKHAVFESKREPKINMHLPNILYSLLKGIYKNMSWLQKKRLNMVQFKGLLSRYFMTNRYFNKTSKENLCVFLEKTSRTNFFYRTKKKKFFLFYGNSFTTCFCEKRLF